jgi:RNA polymerase nonessential primary-like sigma factor
VRSGALDRYFDQLGSYELLDAAEEIALAQEIEAGGPGAAIARDRFVAANLRLVVHVASRYARPSGVDLEDVIQHGNIGLVQAVDRFDWRRGHRFSTFAVWHIRQAVQRGVAACERSVRLPYALHDAILRVSAARSRLEAAGREVTSAELAAATNLSEELVQRALDTRTDVASLDKPATPGAGVSLGDLVAVADDAPDEEIIERLHASETLQAAKALLDERSWRALCLRYGLDGNEPRTYDMIAEELGVARETVRLVLKRAVARLQAAFGAQAA